MKLDQNVYGYNCYPGTGWRKYGRLVINFSQHRITSIWFDGTLVWTPAIASL